MKACCIDSRASISLSQCIASDKQQSCLSVHCTSTKLAVHPSSCIAISLHTSGHCLTLMMGYRLVFRYLAVVTGRNRVAREEQPRDVHLLYNLENRHLLPMQCIAVTYHIGDVLLENAGVAGLTLDWCLQKADVICCHCSSACSSMLIIRAAHQQQ